MIREYQRKRARIAWINFKFPTSLRPPIKINRLKSKGLESRKSWQEEKINTLAIEATLLGSAECVGITNNYIAHKNYHRMQHLTLSHPRWDSDLRSCYENHHRSIRNQEKQVCDPALASSC